MRSSGAKALAGFLLTGFLFALPGALLPAWGYHRDPPEFVMAGNYFLAVTLGVIASNRVARALLPKGVPFLMALGSALACGALLYLAMVVPPVSGWWREGGMAVMGFAAGLLNTGLFQAITADYSRDRAGTVIKGGIFYGLGCFAATVLAAGTLNTYTVPAILTFMAVVPGLYTGLYAKADLSVQGHVEQPTIRQAFRDFRSLGAVLFALLLFFQFGNEWSIAGWLPVFLIRRIGFSPKAALTLLAVYFAALLVGRLAAIAVLPRINKGKLLFGSVLAALFGFLLLFFTNNLFGATVGVLFVGGGFASIYPLVADRIGSRFPYYHPGFFNGIFSFALMGGMLAPATLGYLAAALDIWVVMALPLLGTGMVFVLILLIWLESKVTGQ